MDDRDDLTPYREDIYKRPFITIGFAAWVTMVPLAITSTAGMIRRLGGKRWSRCTGGLRDRGLGVLHYWWLVKADVTRPLAYATVVALLLGFRVYLEANAKVAGWCPDHNSGAVCDERLEAQQCGNQP